MRIQGPSNPNLNRANVAARDDKSAQKTEGKGKSGAVVVSIGDTAKSIATGKTGTAKLGPEISARLQEVREQIKNDSYAIDYSKLASNILNDEVARSGDAE